MSKRALELCLDEAIAALQAAESGTIKLAERDALAAAWGSLLKLRPTWGGRYAGNLVLAFGAASVPAVDKPAAIAPSPLAVMGGSTDFASLTLVDDAQVSQDIEFARLSQQFHLNVDAVMADFDAMISSAMGLPSVRPELNPLRPEVFAKALRGLLDTASVDPPTRAQWLKRLAGPMGRELRGIYEQLLTLLEKSNVQAVSYRRVPVASSSGGGGRGRSGAHAGTDGSQDPAWRGVGGGEVAGLGGGPSADAPFATYADPFQGGEGDALFHDFLVDGGVDDQARLADSYYARVDEELEALKAEHWEPPESLRAELPEPDAMQAAQGRPARRVDGQSSLSSSVWGDYAQPLARKLVRTGLKKEATHVGQVLGLEVVRQLVNQVAQDPRLLAPVRESIVALEPSLLRLAMVDPRFFSEDTHPGRRLMERVAQRSFKYNDEGSSGFLEFFESVRRAFNTLNGQTIDSAQPFNSALAALETAWNEKDRGGQAQQAEVLQGLRFAEERQALADQIAYDMSSRPDLDQVPGPVLDFLYGTWSLVIAHARLVDQANQIDPRGFGTVVSDLVWSVKREFTLRNPAKLMDMIPGLLRSLHAGLDLIGQSEQASAPFFAILMRLHRPVLKLRRLKSERDAQESGAVSLEADLSPATAEQRIPKAAAQPWLAPREQVDTGYEDTLPCASAEAETGAPLPADQRIDAAPEATPEASAAPAQEGGRADQILSGLTTGCWVDLFSRRRWRRAQLIWASTKGTLFMFVSHGGRCHSMTRRSCERLIMDQLLRPVESHGVVAHALATLEQEALAKTPARSQASASEPATRRQAVPA